MSAGHLLIAADPSGTVWLAKNLRTGKKMRVSRRLLPEAEARPSQEAGVPADVRSIAERELSTSPQSRQRGVRVMMGDTANHLLATLGKWLITRRVCVAVGCLGCAAVLSLALQGLPPLRWRDLGAADWLWLGALHALFVAGHELAHAAALVRMGGRLRHFGLLTGDGVLVCVGVEDVYTFTSRPRQAVVVLAGPALTLAICSVCAILLSAIPSDILATAFWLQVLVLTCSVWPFAMSDGYLLAAVLSDTPGLRKVATDCLRSLIVGPRWFLSAEARVRGHAVVMCLCVFGALCMIGRWLIPLILVGVFLIPGRV